MSENEDSTLHDEMPEEPAAQHAEQQPSPAALRESSADAPLTPPPPPQHTAVLSKLSSSPFPRNGFPLLGILASVYEHVVAVAGRPIVPGGPARLDSPQPDRAA